MKQLKKIKLNDLNESELKEREMNALYAGRACSCSALHPVVHQFPIMEMVTIELVKVVVTLFLVHLLYASLTSLETVFKVLLIIGNT